MEKVMFGLSGNKINWPNKSQSAVAKATHHEKYT
jgi:hypothetical protein